MQNRSAIILSLGMLLEKVDVSGFIGKLILKAMAKNKDFKFTPALQKQAFDLSELYNRNGVEAEDFRGQVLQLLGLDPASDVNEKEFWDAWQLMVTVGDVAAKIKEVQDVAAKHYSIVYLASDTNGPHVDKIVDESAKHNVILDIDKQPRKFGPFQLYLSFELEKNRLDLIKHIVEVANAQNFKPAGIVLVLGNPENIKDASQKKVVQAECEAITKWCSENNVSVKLLDNTMSLGKNLEQIFTPEVTSSNTRTMAMS
ncbi:MAG: hypothetical protein V4501_05065 [Pseudomonadota bacterium]